jgi:outer membrane protein assembly factor BamB
MFLLKVDCPQKIFLMAFLLVVLIMSEPTLADTWPGWRGMNRDGISNETVWQAEHHSAEPNLLWEAQVGIGFSSFAVVDGHAYTMGHTEKQDLILCLKVETGEEVWRYAYEAPLYAEGAEGGPTSTPYVCKDSVYALSRTGHLHALHRRTGQVLWSHHLVTDFDVPIPQYGFASSPLVYADRLYVDAGKLLAFKLETGALVWSTPDFEVGYSSPVVLDVSGIVGLLNFNATSLKVVELQAGQVISSFPWETSSKINVATPILHNRQAFISSAFGMGCVLLDFANPKLPQVVWRNNHMHNHFGSCVCWNDALYGFDGHFTRNEGWLTCLDWKTGEVHWREESLSKGSLIIANGTLIILTEKGELILGSASPNGFEEYLRTQVLGGKVWTPPVLSEGRLFCRNTAGQVVCLGMTWE